MDLLVCLAVGAPDDMPGQVALVTIFPLDKQPNIHVVKQEELFTVSRVTFLPMNLILLSLCHHMEYQNLQLKNIYTSTRFSTISIIRF